MSENVEKNEKGDKKYGLARFVPLGKKFDREVHRATDTDDESLEKRRVEYGRNELLLRKCIERLQTMTLPEPLPVEATPERRAEYDAALMKYRAETDQLFTLINVQGIVGIYAGAGIVQDMVSLRLRDRDERSGERFYYRFSVAEMLYDIAGFLETMRDTMERQTEALEAIAIKGGAAFQGQYTGQTRVERQAEAENEMAAEAGVAEPGVAPGAVSEAEVAAAQAEPTDADVDKFVGKVKARKP